MKIKFNVTISKDAENTIIELVGDSFTYADRNDFLDACKVIPFDTVKLYTIIMDRNITVIDSGALGALTYLHNQANNPDANFKILCDKNIELIFKIQGVNWATVSVHPVPVNKLGV